MVHFLGRKQPLSSRSSAEVCVQPPIFRRTNSQARRGSCGVGGGLSESAGNLPPSFHLATHPPFHPPSVLCFGAFSLVDSAPSWFLFTAFFLCLPVSAAWLTLYIKLPRTQICWSDIEYPYWTGLMPGNLTDLCLREIPGNPIICGSVGYSEQNVVTSVWGTFLTGRQGLWLWHYEYHAVQKRMYIFISPFFTAFKSFNYSVDYDHNTIIVFSFLQNPPICRIGFKWCPSSLRLTWVAERL